MKKLLSLIVCALCLVLIACDTPIEKRQPNLSELRDVVMTAQSDRMKISLMSGVRENPFVIDGVPGEKTPFTVVTVTPSGFDESTVFSYSIYLGEEKAEGTFSKHPFKNTWSFEIPKQALDNVALTVTAEGYAENFELSSVKTADMIGAEEALEIAEIRLKDRIKEHTSGGTLNAEIYIRFLENPISSEGGYYWYVAFVPDKYEVYAVLIDPISREIAAVRE